MVTSKKYKYSLMIIHILITIMLIVFKNYKTLSMLLGGVLLCVSLFTIVYMCFLAVNNDFYWQIIAIVFILIRQYSFGWDYITFGANATYILQSIIIISLAISLFVGLKCKLKKRKDCIVPTIAIFIFTAILGLCTTNILNVALSCDKAYTVEYRLIEKTDEHDANYPTDVSTQTYKAVPVTDSYEFNIGEIEVKQKLNVNTSDVVVVEIRKGLFENVYRVLNVRESGNGSISSDTTEQ